MMLQQRMLIGGAWVEASSGRRMPVVNPAEEMAFASVPIAEPKDVEAAIDAAEAAFPDWAGYTPAMRGQRLRDASTLVLEKAQEIAALMTKEQGKPLAEALGEVKKGAEILRYYAAEGERVCGRIIANAEADIESHVIYQPMGVAAAISPWNYPIELLAWKVGSALAAGCTLVAKLPSETPLSPLAFLSCLVDTGVPPGAVNGITGPGGVVGSMLIKSPKVKKVAFTGSTEVGRQVLRDSADTLKKVSLELGGSLPMIVCRDADLDAAAAGAARRSFRNMGQICIAVNRIYVDRKVYLPFLEKFTKAAAKLTIGNGLTDPCDLGPMCTSKGIEKVSAHIADALEKGAKLCFGGCRPEGPQYARGYYYMPTILRDATHEMRIMQEETFGPAAGVMAFDTLEEAVNLANDTPYGLAAIVYTESLRTAHRLSREIQAGNIAINNVDAGVINAPYGGWKDSGFGHEHGPEGLYEYLHIKHIRVRY